MNNINVTMELCQEDRNRLDTLIAIGLELCKKNSNDVQPTVPTEGPLELCKKNSNDVQPTVPTEGPLEVVETANVPTAETVHPVDAALPWGEPASEVPAEEPVREITAAELLAMVQKLAAPGTGKRDKAKAIVQAYGAKVSDVPDDKRAECMDKLIALDQEVVE